MPGTMHGIWSPGLGLGQEAGSPWCNLGCRLVAWGWSVAGSQALAGDWRALPGPDRAGRVAREPQLIGKRLLA